MLAVQYVTNITPPATQAWTGGILNRSRTTPPPAAPDRVLGSSRSCVGGLPTGRLCDIRVNVRRVVGARAEGGRKSMFPQK